MTFLEKKKARAAQVKSELEGIRVLMDVAPDDKLDGHYQRAQVLTAELRALNADIADLQAEAFDPADPDGRTAAVNGLVPSVSRNHKGEITGYCVGDGQFHTVAHGDEIPAIVRSMAAGQQVGAKVVQTCAQMADKVIFRSDEKISDKYDVSDIDADKCLRAAITGNYEKLNDIEKRALTPNTGGAMLAPEISSIVIDNMRQSDWMQIFQPTIVYMQEGETKIPNIAALPTAIMHMPGNEEAPTNPVITAATLKAKTMMCLVEVANELLTDAATSRGIILQACIDAMSNKLLQQVLYGTGDEPDIKGVTTYPAASFADAGNQAAEKDLFRLVTMAKMSIIKRNGVLNAMLYDCDLEDRFNKRLFTGEVIQPCRAFSELYATGRVLAHPSVKTGDMVFMQADSLFLGMRQQLEIQIDPYSSFNSNNTKFRVILRADAFANTPKMVYYSDIPAVEPA